MSVETLKAIEDAITAHAKEQEQLEGHGIINGWILAYETTHSDDEHGVVYGQQYVVSDISPATSAGIARWAGRQIENDAMPVMGDMEDDDE